MSQQDYVIKDYSLHLGPPFPLTIFLSLALLVLREASCYDMRTFRELYRNALVARDRDLWQTASEELKPANNYMCELRSKFSSLS